MDTEILKIPAVALRGMVILPGMIAHFDISRGRSIRAIEQCMMDSQKIFLSAQKDAGVDAAYQPDHIIRELPELVDYLEERNRAERLTMQ